MATIASLVVTVGANLVEFERGIQKAERQLSTLSSAVDRIGSSMQTAGKVMTAAITLPILAVGAAAVKLGMDAVESENLVSVSFGNMRASADEWSKHLSESLGLNQFELRKTAGTLFNMTTSMGLGKEAAFEMSTGVVELAADMASFRNIGMDEALQKIQAGLTGEADPLKRLGILVDETTVKTYAYKTGIAKQGEELTAQQKVLARYQAILAQTKNDQGDLARTLESPANQLRIMKTRVEEAATSLGVALMPMVQQVIAGVASLVPYLQRAVQWFTELPEPVRMAALAAVGLAAATGPLLYLMGGLLQTLPGLIALWRAYETAQIAAKLASIGVNVAMIGVAGAIGAAVVVLGLLYAASQKWNVTTGQSNEQLEAQVEALKKAGGTMALSRAAAIERELVERQAAAATHTNTAANADLEAQLKRQANAMQEEIARQLAAASALDGTSKSAKKLREEMAKFDSDQFREISQLMAGGVGAPNLATFESDRAAAPKAPPGMLTAEQLHDIADEWRELNRLQAGGNGAPNLATFASDVAAGALAPKAQDGFSISKFLGANIAGVTQSALQGGGSLGKSLGSMFGSGISQKLFGEGGDAGLSALGTKIASSAGRMFGDTVGKMVGSFLPGIGALAGPIMSGLGKLVGALFGGEGKKTNDERDSWVMQNFGSQDQLRKLATEAGATDSELRKLFDTHKVKTFEAAAAAITAKIKEQQAIVAKYNLTWTDFQGTRRIDEFTTSLKTITKDTEALERAGLSHQDALGKTAAAYVELAKQGIAAGTGIEPALAPVLKQLAEMGLLTGEMVSALSGVASDGLPTWQEMEKAAEKYGLKLDGMGERYQQLRITDSAESLLHDFDLLVKGGVPVTHLLGEMGDEVNTFVRQAIAMGSTVPDAMKPMLQQFADAGFLTDESGDKLKDLSKIKFAQPLEDAIHGLIDKLGELIDKISDVGGAFAGLPNAMPDIHVPHVDGGMIDAMPMAEGGSGRVTRPTLFLAGEAGAEDYMFSGGGKSFSRGGDPSLSRAIDALRRDLLYELPAKITRGVTDGLTAAPRSRTV